VFSSSLAQQISECLTERDFLCLRDLYKRIKEIISQDNAEKVFDLQNTNQLLDLHLYIDEMFEACLTDNHLTDRIFRESYAKKHDSLQPAFNPSQSAMEQLNTSYSERLQKAIGQGTTE